jgi:hypothetical protein
MSYCTKHPGKEAVGACCECGHLVCKACYTELNDKVYCSSCANKLFTPKQQETSSAIQTPTPAQPKPPKAEMPKPAEPVNQVVQPEPAKPDVIPVPASPAEQAKPPVAATPPVAQGIIPAAKIDTVPIVKKEAAPALKTDAVPSASAENKPSRPVASSPKSMGFLWWLAPIFLAFIGGLLAWFMQKNNEPGKAKAMLFTGIGLTVIYAAVITAFFLLPGNASSSGTILYASFADNSWQICRMDPDGKNSSRLTACDNNSLYFNVYPSWSAKTRQLACYSNRDGNFEVYRIDEQGANQTNLTLNNFTDLFCDLSPDGNRIAFGSNRDGNYEIYSMDSDGSNIKQLTFSKPTDDRPRWSPDGTQIVFNTDRDGTHEIYVMNADGSNQRRLTNNDKWDGMARFSHDGKKIVFVSERDGNPEIYTMDSDGNNQKRVTFNSAKDYGPCYSPDGTRIAYYSNLDGNDEIYVMNPDGGNQIRLTTNKTGDQFPLWISTKFKAPAKLTIPPVRTLFMGSNVTTANKYYNFSDNITYVKYTAEKDGSIDMIRVYSGSTGKIKVALYDHNNKDDMPLSKLRSNDEAVPCQANQWNNIYIAPITLNKGVTYWLAFNSDINGLVMLGGGQDKMLKGKAVFEGFTFPEKPPADMAVFKSNLSISCWGFGEPQSNVEPVSSPESD